MRYLAGFGTGVRYGVHCFNYTNLARGIVERVFYVRRGEGLAPAPQPSVGVFSRLNAVRQRLLRAVRPTPVVARDEYPGLYTGRKRGVYERALESLKVRAINFRDAWVNTFVKAEKVNLDSKGDPAPRVIQPRSPRYNLEVGRYLKLFEKELCAGFERVWGYPVVLKGKNAQDVGAAMADHWQQFAQPVAVGLDASRFDQHVSKDALRWEHSVYNSVFNSPELRRLLQWQLRNHGIARVEDLIVEYDIEGCRMSGDINTGLGNCLIMSSIVIAYCEQAGIYFRLANNGDDCVLFVDKADLGALAGIDQWFLDFGFTLTREEPVYVLEQVVFCQAQPVLTSTGWRMVRDPRTAMSKDCVSLLGWDNAQSFKLWASAIGACGLSLTRGVPVWEAWYSRLVHLGAGAVSQGVADHVWDSGLGYMSRGVLGGEVDAEARVSFYRAFGILPDLQEALEAEYACPMPIGSPTPMMHPSIVAIDTTCNPLATWLAAK
ncbi:hypothetical protein 1 [Shahe tombus-like virus 1]|uniref:hypothetical protein 1 n=1 Tax=Shahe tombus-like virus 1 TaxID=1923455 RepID=UPI00090A09A4|nr:hypothetical protein 1 [Shahe tombus-like virus 1]APG76369.1 hypothetical protein 1 [Shahe tombus-like virus 1]